MNPDEEPEYRRPLSDSGIKAAWHAAARARARAEREYRDPELSFLIELTLVRVQAAGRDLADARWRPGPAAQRALRYLWDAYRAPLSTDEEESAATAREQDRAHGRRGTEHTLGLVGELSGILATGAGEEANACYHLSALRELYAYAAALYDGSGYERAATVTERLAPVESRLVALWAAATGSVPEPL